MQGFGNRARLDRAGFPDSLRPSLHRRVGVQRLREVLLPILLDLGRHPSRLRKVAKIRNIGGEGGFGSLRETGAIPE
jgi:hypothetical protein